jgi:2-polyprenyl-3-methyl-5-hydroxy-6-metoxy-1,4-benzoquinol methylase
MVNHAETPSHPSYDDYRRMSDVRAPLAESFARQIIDTCGPYFSKPVAELDVLDIGCGYGHTTLELARACRSALGVEPTVDLFRFASNLQAESGVSTLEFRHQGVDDLDENDRFDLVVLDNVYEHLPNQAAALQAISTRLRPGGVVFLLIPNKLWPIEAHYRLPFLSYLPLRLANLYLRITRRGNDYADASYAPTWWRLRRQLARHRELSFQFTLPANPTATMSGSPVHYRVGMALLKRFPSLWAVSKSFLVVVVKEGDVRRTGD